MNGNLTNQSGTTLTGGTYIVSGTLQYNGANIVTDAAKITLNGASAQIVNQASANALVNLATITATGGLTLNGWPNFTTAGNFTDNGVLALGSGITFVLSGADPHQHRNARPVRQWSPQGFQRDPDADQFRH